MDLRLNTTLIGDYKSQSQIARVLTEDWLFRNSYCPACGQASLVHFENNRPVADFFCQDCSEEYELKSKKGKFSQLINDGAYATMMERVQADNNPNFFFLTYSKSFEVDHFLVLPKQFIRPETIIKRPPSWLGASSARCQSTSFSTRQTFWTLTSGSGTSSKAETRLITWRFLRWFWRLRGS